MDNIKELLKKQLADNEAVIFVGAGVSMSATKGNTVTNWKGLLEHGIDFIVKEISGTYEDSWRQKLMLELNSDDINDLLGVATKIENILTGNDKFGTWLNNAFGEMEVKDDGLIKAIVQLDAPIITTNYDFLLEKVSGYNHATWVNMNNIEPILRRMTDYFKKHIIHLHGYFDEPDTIILGYKSYYRIINDQKIQTILKAIRTLKTIIYVGVGDGIRDPNFENFRNWSADIFRDSKYSHYRLVRSSEMEASKKMHKPEEHIEIIPYGDKFEDLLPFIQSLIPTATGSDTRAREIPNNFTSNTQSLTLYLSRLNHDSNAWNKFFGYIEFTGRKDELQHLTRFGFSENAESNLTWSIIFGKHGVGKSRLAMEWLNVMKGSGWATGFFEYIPDQLKELLELTPDSNTAIVIDNIDNTSEYIWVFIYTLFQRWRSYPVQFRILLIAQMNLGVSTGNHVITESVINLAFNEGLKIDPLTDEGEKRRIVELAATQADKKLEEEEIKLFMNQSGGRPAFLALAGTYKQEWKHKLGNYANEKLKKAYSLFGDDGVRILILSALAGTVTDADRELIAPQADNPVKLSELYSRSVTYLSDNIPELEPELFAFEIIYAGLSNYFSRNKKRKLLSAILERFADFMMRRVINMWREETAAENFQHIYHDIIEATENPDSERYSRFRVLELLFDVIAEGTQRKGTDHKFVKLSRVRATVFATVLASPEIESMNSLTCMKIVKLCLHPNLSPTGWGSFIQLIHQDFPADNKTRYYWASLIDWNLGSGNIGAKIEERLISEGKSGFILGKSFKDVKAGALILEYLQSDADLESIYGFFLLLNYGNDSDNISIDMLPEFAGIYSETCKLLESGNKALVITALMAIRTIAFGNKGINNNISISEKEREKIFELLFLYREDALLFEYVCSTLGSIYQVQYRLHHIFSWFSFAPNIYKITNAEPQPLKLPKDKVDKLLDLLVKFNPSQTQRFELSLLLLRISEWHAEMAAAFELFLFDGNESEELNLEVIIRMAKLRKSEAALVLRNLLNRSKYIITDWEQLTILASMLLFENIKILRQENYEFDCKIPGINLPKLESEAEHNRTGNLFSGEEFHLLFDRLFQIYLSKRGHQVHKLKAKDTTGRWAYYFVHVLPENIDKFYAAIAGDGTIDLEDFGNVVTSNYGDTPSDSTLEYLREKYNFEV